jgi:hypothetical protein
VVDNIIAAFWAAAATVAWLALLGLGGLLAVAVVRFALAIL